MFKTWRVTGDHGDFIVTLDIAGDNARAMATTVKDAPLMAVSYKHHADLGYVTYAYRTDSGMEVRGNCPTLRECLALTVGVGLLPTVAL